MNERRMEVKQGHVNMIRVKSLLRLNGYEQQLDIFRYFIDHEK